MSRATRTYRNIGAKIRFFGLEVGDWGALAAVAGAAFAFSDHALLDAVAVLALWAWMRWVKGKKPEGYTSIYLSRMVSLRELYCEAEQRGRND